LWHASNLYRIPQQEQLAEALCAHTFADRVFFANSGAEAMECAIKTAKRWHHAAGRPERYRFVTFANCFHGRTLATISATDQSKIRDGFEPLLDWFDTVPFNDLAAVQRAIGPHTAAILVEPIQGEGGLTVAAPGFLQGLRALCDKHELLLVYDEVQTGMGRTGHLFAYEIEGVIPDILASAKGLGGGFPIGACLSTERAAAGMAVGAHGSTFGGNPLGCAVALAVLDAVTAPGFLQGVRERGQTMRSALERLAARHPNVFGAVRGHGLMLGLEAKGPSRNFVNHARTFGVMTAAAGGDVVRVLPPLNISQRDIEVAEARLDLAAAAWTAQSTT
jgi:acetylornithine/N-succinyldiaminopimelate aminotransferase